MVRLFGLLGLLGFGFLCVSLLPTSEVAREALIRESAPEQMTSVEPEPETAPALSHLPPAVRRLADAPVAAGLRPVVFGEATPIPAALPASQSASSSTGLRDAQSTFRAIKAQRANVRSGPSTDYEVIGRLSRGEEVEVLERDGSWLLVRLEGDGFEGWISASLLAD